MVTNNQEIKQPERLINIRELSDLTGMKISTLYLWSSTNRIPVIHAGKSLRYKYSAVLRALENNYEAKH